TARRATVCMRALHNGRGAGAREFPGLASRGRSSNLGAMAYRTAPTETTGMPPGIPYIVGNEAAERFTFYGLKGVLVIFMTKYLLDRSGAKDLMTDDQAKTYFHFFVASVYFFPTLGAIISDWLWGKYTTII